VCAAVLLTATTAYAAGDAARGKSAFLSQCSGCHTVVANTSDGMGPNLFGVVGRKAGARSSYNYSTAMKSSGITWTPDKLKTFIMHPNETVSGSNMMFMGVSVSGQADDIVAY